MAEVRPFKEWATLLVQQQKERTGAVHVDRAFRVHDTVLVAWSRATRGRGSTSASSSSRWARRG
jgi:hypothetical protein